MSKHTPGPWTVEGPLLKANSIQEYVVMGGGRWAAGGRTIAEIGCWRDRPDPDADAHLIAAAPELLAALRLAYEAITSYEVIPRHEWEAVMNEAEEKAEAALKKAEGNR